MSKLNGVSENTSPTSLCLSCCLNLNICLYLSCKGEELEGGEVEGDAGEEAEEPEVEAEGDTKEGDD